MTSYKKFEVSDTDSFDINKLAMVREEIRQLTIHSEDLPAAFKAEIIISFTKDHSITNEWKAANPELVVRILSGRLPYKNMEALFESCANNKKYRQDLEKYITAELSGIELP